MPAGCPARPILALRVDLEVTQGVGALERLLAPWAGGGRG